MLAHARVCTPCLCAAAETLIVTILVILGALLWTRVLAKFCDVATNSDPGLTEFRQGLDGLNDFIRENNLPKEMGRRMRECVPHAFAPPCGTRASRHARRARVVAPGNARSTPCPALEKLHPGGHETTSRATLLIPC